MSPKRLITYYALCWILDIKTCTLSLLGHEEGVLIVHEYDQKYLCPMLVRCYEQLHCMQESTSASQLIPRETHVRSGLHIFDIASSSGEPTKEWIESRGHFDNDKLTSRTSSALSNVGRNMKSCFLLWRHLFDKYWIC